MTLKNKEIPDHTWVDDLIERALREDIREGDITTDAIVDSTKQAVAVWVAKQNGIIAGLDVAKKVFRQLDPNLLWKPLVRDGDAVSTGDTFLEFRGTARALLTAERVALNFAQRMSGIATKTAEMVHILHSYPTRILDTRKTVPGLRYLDKYAVRAGGGSNHRMGLYDMIMIKDNHIRAAGSITGAVAKARAYRPGIKIEVETVSLDQVKEALRAGADRIMLDNMDIPTMKKAVELTGGRVETEASGNIVASRLKETAETGVDYISVGALTHSAEAFDMSQQIKEMI